MEDQELYDLGYGIDSVLNQAKHLLQSPAYRFTHLVNNSPLGYDCTYARITSRNFHEQDELNTLRKTLESLSNRVNAVLESLPATTEEPRWLQNLRQEQQQ